MKNELKEIYSGRIANCSDNLAHVDKKINAFVAYRSILAIFGIALSIYCFNVVPLLGILIFIASASLFYNLVKQHSRLDFTKLQLSMLIKINEEEINRLAGNNSEYNTGEEYIDMDHPYAADLDLFGKGSLFQYINRTSGNSGRECLAKWLLETAEEKEILLRQDAVTELKNKIDWRQDFQAIGRLTKEKEHDLDLLVDWLNDPAYFSNIKIYEIILTILPFATITLLFLSIFLIPITIPGILILVQIWIIRENRKKIKPYYLKTQGKYEVLLKYEGLIESIEGERFTSEKLMLLRNHITESRSNKTASENINSLAKIVNAFDWRLNMIYPLINAVFMWDIQCILRLEKWKSTFKDEMRTWFTSIHEIDALSSLGTFYFNNPEFTMPKITSSKFVVKAGNLGHPLINESSRICNDLDMDGTGKFILITGSNMAGKSTFIRSVGLGLVLATTGAPICADHFEFYPMKIYTSMRVKDSLDDGESSFYAELKRLKLILDNLNKKEKVMVLLDEILRGTNSEDKHTGSKAFIKQLTKYHCMGLIATHDLELGGLADQFPEKIKNCCFEVLIKGEKFTYDYKLKEGVCQTLNATVLMKHMGITI
ncbi:MAG: hypothetical protein JKY52_07130 [Flavobacteriales bacterium]|nr:hypothetical protein [Flavobacteriales bacterium]